MASSVIFHLPFLSPARKPKGRAKDESSLYVESTVGGSDHSMLYPESHTEISPARSLDWHLQHQYEGNPLLNTSSDSCSLIDGTYAQQMCLYPPSRTLCTERKATIETLWACQYCDAAFFRTEHETMMHELSCSSNSCCPLKSTDHEQISTGSHHSDCKGRRLAKVLMKRSSSAQESRQDLNMKTTLGGSNKIDSRRDRERVSADELSDRNSKKKKGLKNKMKSIVRRNKHKDGVRPAKKFSDFNAHQERTRGSGIQSSATDDLTIDTAESYDMTRLNVPSESCDPFRDTRYPSATRTRRRNLASSRSESPQVSNSSFSIEDEIKTAQHEPPKQAVVVNLSRLSRRPSAEELMEQLGLSNHKVAKEAIEILRSRPDSSDDESENSRSTYSTWDEEEIAGILVPNYDEFVDMAVAGFRRNVLGIDDALYRHLKSINTHLFKL